MNHARSARGGAAGYSNAPRRPVSVNTATGASNQPGRSASSPKRAAAVRRGPQQRAEPRAAGAVTRQERVEEALDARRRALARVAAHRLNISRPDRPAPCVSVPRSSCGAPSTVVCWARSPRSRWDSPSGPRAGPPTRGARRSRPPPPMLRGEQRLGPLARGARLQRHRRAPPPRARGAAAVHRGGHRSAVARSSATTWRAAASPRGSGRARPPGRRSSPRCAPAACGSAGSPPTVC